MYIIPEVKYIKEDRDSFFLLTSFSNICFSRELVRESYNYGLILKKAIKENTGLNLSYLVGEKKKGDIFITLSPSLEDEEYTLSIDGDNIILKAQNKKGVLYAIHTLIQVIEQKGASLPFLEIRDCPDFPHRGYYLDQSRGRVLNKEFLKRFIFTLSRYKINEFQLYIEHTYLFQEKSEVWRDETPLTAEDIIELDNYCNSLNIELIPSLSSFGHLFTLLNTKSFNKYCEKERDVTPFSFYERMNHHTVNVTDKEVIPFIESLIEEYMSLFTSNKFNLCADETFDLGKGKSKENAEKYGVHRIYIDYVKELASFLVSKGKIPMFWGDIICGEPELVKELPENIICLNWGYAPDQSEEPTKKMAATGVMQYLCPGVCGWNQWMNLIENSYKNITRMCNYAHKYKAIGILNTDWGDFGHINDTSYSLPGLIYGANFSWNSKEISFSEMNKRISLLEYKDKTESIVSLMSEMSKNSIYDWCQAVFYYERKEWGKTSFNLEPFKALNGENENLKEIQTKLLSLSSSMDSSKVSIIENLDNTITALSLWNRVSDLLKKKEDGKEVAKNESSALASCIEQWFMKYKELWRETSREGDLKHVSHIVFWYCDLLRDF